MRPFLRRGASGLPFFQGFGHFRKPVEFLVRLDGPVPWFGTGPLWMAGMPHAAMPAAAAASGRDFRQAPCNERSSRYEAQNDQAILIWRSGRRRRGARGRHSAQPGRDSDAGLHAGRHIGDCEGDAAGIGARDGRRYYSRQYVSSDAAAGRGPGGAIGRAASIHELGRADSDRFGRIPSDEPGGPAAAYRKRRDIPQPYRRLPARIDSGAVHGDSAPSGVRHCHGL